MIGVCAVLTSQNKQITNNQNCDRISAVVSDSAFANLAEEISWRMSQQLLLYPTMLLKPTIKMLDIFNRFFYGYSVFDVSAVNCVSNESFNTPIFLIHSGADSIVPVSHAHEIYDKCTSKIKKLWIIESSDHCMSIFSLFLFMFYIFYESSDDCIPLCFMSVFCFE